MDCVWIKRGQVMDLIILFAGICVIIILGIWVITMYNRFITLAERVTNGKAQIATQIESRWDALKNLISATKEYAQHESEVLVIVTEKRTNIGKDSSIREIQKNDSELNQVLGRLMMISENYPDLKASHVYQTAMDSVKVFENNVRHSRMISDDVVTKYNRQLKLFPANVIAKLFRFTEKEYFESTESKEEMPSWE